jgi:hypothetical protein
MNPRERFLAMLVLGLVLVLGLGFGFFIFIHKPFSEQAARLDRARKDIESRVADLKKEKDKNEEILKADPRLAYWKQLSIPEPKSKDPQEVKKQQDQMQVEYERYLSDLLRKSEFNPTTVQITSKAFESKSTPKLSAKVPMYSMVSFHIAGQTSLKGLIGMMEGFHKTPLLHQIKDLRVIKPNTPRQGGRPGDLDVDFNIEVLQMTGAEKREALMPSVTPLAERVGELAVRIKDAEKIAGDARDEGFTGVSGKELAQLGTKLTELARRGKLLANTEGAENQLTDLLTKLGDQKTIAFAETAESLAGQIKMLFSRLNKAEELKLVVLAESKRAYDDILNKNMFTGRAGREARLTEDPREVLGVIKLAHIQYNGRRWEAYLFNQALKPDADNTNERILNTVAANKLNLEDRYGAPVLEATIVHISSTHCVYFKAKDKEGKEGKDGKDKYYRMNIGEFLTDALAHPLDVVQEDKDGKAIWFRDEDGSFYRMTVTHTLDPKPPQRGVGVNLLAGYGATLPR